MLKNKGFGLLEVLAAAGLLAVAAAFLVPALGGVQSYLYKMQAQRAAQQMAGDIAALQQYCFYDGSRGSQLEMDVEKDGYRIYHAGTLFSKRKFSTDSGLYFEQHFGALKFSPEGAPSTTDENVKAVNYIIKCRHDKNISYWLQVQPVTGRVVFK